MERSYKFISIYKTDFPPVSLQCLVPQQWAQLIISTLKPNPFFRQCFSFMEKYKGCTPKGVQRPNLLVPKQGITLVISVVSVLSGEPVWLFRFLHVIWTYPYLFTVVIMFALWQFFFKAVPGRDLFPEERSLPNYPH